MLIVYRSFSIHVISIRQSTGDAPLKRSAPGRTSEVATFDKTLITLCFMTKKQRFIFNTLCSVIFTIAFCAAPNISPLHAAKKTRQTRHHKLRSSSIHRPHKKRTANSVSSTNREAIDSGDSYLVAEGKASYYARNFRGKKTASGESFNLRHFTAAHRSLPFGTSVKVINLDNGKNVVVRINDRGPHLKGRIIDVSPAAAKEIGLLGNGTANVRIEAFD